MEKDRLQIGPPQRHVKQFKASLDGVVKQSGNLRWMVDGELRRAVDKAPRMMLDPCVDRGGCAGKARQHLAARSKGAVNQFFIGSGSDDVAVVDDCNAIAEPLRLLHVMR